METLPLHSTHERSHAVFGERQGREVVRHYGDPEGEYRSARSAAVLVDLSFRDALRITGDDRLSFLHGMCTNDIKGLPAWGTAYAAMITVKGAMVADGRAVRREVPQDVVLDLEPGTQAPVRAFLDQFLISEDAELHDGHADLAVLGLVGPRTFEVLEQAFGARITPDRRIATVPGQEPPPGELPRILGFEPRHLSFGDDVLVVMPSLFTRGDGADLLVPRARLEELWSLVLTKGATVALRAAGLDALEPLRIEEGVPRFGQDLLETTIPLEANLTHAISYNKGCYVGQEVIARATFRGSMNKRLVGLSFGATAPAERADLRNGEKKVGTVTSVTHSPIRGEYVGLGYVHRAHMQPGTTLSVGDGGMEAAVLPLPLPPPAV